MRLLAYLRVSTEEQAVDGFSLGAQQAQIEAWAKARGDEIASFHSDEGVSGAVQPEKRHGWNTLKKKMRQLTGVNKIDGVVVAAVDRLTRSVVDLLSLSAEFTRERRKLFSLRESLDSTTSMGRFTMTLIGAVAELERGLIGERTVAGMKEVRRKNLRFSGTPPWGSKFEAQKDGTQKLVLDEAEAEVSAIVIEYQKQGYGQGEIAEVLQKETGNSPRNHKPWSWKGVSNIYRSLRRQGQRLAVFDGMEDVRVGKKRRVKHPEMSPWKRSRGKWVLKDEPRMEDS